MGSGSVESLAKPSDIHDYRASTATRILRHKTGVVIPVYLPAGVDVIHGEALLRDTTAAYCGQVDDPSAVCLSVDGEQFGARAAGLIAQEYGTSLHVAPVNRGKLAPAANGVRLLLQRSDIEYIAVVDQDGDHFASELHSFVRAAEHITALLGHDRVIVLGQRISRHRPMGFLRGELEELADRVLLDALAYRAAQRDRPLRLEYANALGEFPDFHSGYKLFSRPVAERVFLGEPHLAGVSDACYYRHACEAVMVVEALEHGAYLGVVNRHTFNEQPISTFGLFNRSELMADTIIWPCKRLGVPLHFVQQWMANHMSRLTLSTLAPEGKEELKRVWQRVTAAYGGECSAKTLLQPLFV